MDNGEEGAFAEIDALLARTASTVARPARRDETGLVYDPDWDQATLLAQWRAQVTAIRSLPPLIAAALAFEAWEMIGPLQHRGRLGALLAAAQLQALTISACAFRSSARRLPRRSSASRNRRRSG